MLVRLLAQWSADHGGGGTDDPRPPRLRDPSGRSVVVPDVRSPERRRARRGHLGLNDRRPIARPTRPGQGGHAPGSPSCLGSTGTVTAWLSSNGIRHPVRRRHTSRRCATVRLCSGMLAALHEPVPARTATCTSAASSTRSRDGPCAGAYFSQFDSSPTSPRGRQPPTASSRARRDPEPSSPRRRRPSRPRASCVRQASPAFADDDRSPSSLARYWADRPTPAARHRPPL